MENTTNIYLIDTSIIGTSLEDFQRVYIANPKNIFVLTNLTFKELEARKKDTPSHSRKFVRFLIDFFVTESERTKLVNLDKNDSFGNHIDELLVEYAKQNNYSILTADKGMALWCKFKSVQFNLLEIIEYREDFPFISEDNQDLFLDLKNVPSGTSVFVLSTDASYVKKTNQYNTVGIEEGDLLLVACSASSSNEDCIIKKYRLFKGKWYLLSKLIVNPDNEENMVSLPYFGALYSKWKKNK